MMKANLRTRIAEAIRMLIHGPYPQPEESFLLKTYRERAEFLEHQRDLFLSREWQATKALHREQEAFRKYREKHK